MYQPSEKAQQIIEAISGFVRNEILPLEQQAGLSWAEPHPRAVLQQVWQRSCEQGFYNIMLPEAIGGAGLSVSDLCAVKEATVLTGSMLAPHILGELSDRPVSAICSRWRARPRSRRSCSRCAVPKGRVLRPD